MIEKKVAQIVKQTLGARFPEVQVIRIRVEEDFDADDKAILRIDITFKTKSANFDLAKLRELPRLIMPKLKEAKETKEAGFPLFSYIAKSELGKQKAARSRAS
jgi:hypothetical protein